MSRIPKPSGPGPRFNGPQLLLVEVNSALIGRSGEVNRAPEKRDSVDRTHQLPNGRHNPFARPGYSVCLRLPPLRAPGQAAAGQISSGSSCSRVRLPLHDREPPATNEIIEVRQAR